MKSKLLLLLTAVTCTAWRSVAQDTLQHRHSLLVYPVAFYLPETRWGAGMAGSYNFYLDKSDSISPPSTVQAGIAITQNNQVLLSFPYQFYWKQRRHSLTGEIAYNDYAYYFYGTGPGNLEGQRELYKVRFPLMRINYLRKVDRNWFAGMRWWYEDYQVYGVEKNGLLASGIIPGSRGGITSGPGIVGLYDTRDNIFFTLSGNYLELVFHNQQEIWGSDFNYNRYRLDYRHFMRTGESGAVGLNLFGDMISGNVPFSQMPGIGSEKRMRGYYGGRYRDNQLILMQAEYRNFFYKRWGAVAFVNYALLADKVSTFSLNNDHAGAGAGIRFAFDRQKRINLRLDAAWPIGRSRYTDNNFLEQAVIYFTIGEAF